MKILMLTPYLPYPLSSGGQIRSYNLLKNLSPKHQITLISLIKHDQEKDYIKFIKPYCEKVIAAKRPEKPWTINNILKTGFGWYPFLVVRNYSSAAKNAVVNELNQGKYDLIHAETFYVMPHIPKTKVPILLVEQTIEYLVYKHYVDTINFLPVRALLTIDVGKIRYWEEYFWKQARRVVAMSEADKKVMQKHLKSLDVSIVPNGVDKTFFKFKTNKISPNPTILFVGNFNWLQNREAVFELVKKIWPLIVRKIPKARLWIVGRFPPPEITNLKSNNIEILSHIEDIRQAYQKSDLLLAPIYGPGGTRYKILEAMASGIPVVTTPQGIEGLGVKDGTEALVRSDYLGLAESSISVLTDQKLYEKLASNANQLVIKKYNWAKIASDLDKIYEEVAYGKK